MNLFSLKPNSSYVKAYYASLKQFHEHGYKSEGNTRAAFADLLKRCAAPYDWHLVEEFQFKGTGKQSLRADGALVDDLTLVHGIWEAKDLSDDLPKEVKSKVAKGYPLTNTLFQSPDRAILYQGHIAADLDITDPENLIDVLQRFFDHRESYEVDWEIAVLKFSEEIPKLAAGVTDILNAEHKKNVGFRERFQGFVDLCRHSINPDLTEPAIQKMLVQHLLTERIFRKVFDNREFLSRNVIAAEIEKVIQSITARHFSRDTFLKPLDRFYKAIEKAAEFQTGYTEKQHFLNAVYEKFFQSFDHKQSDTHGIVYTPQPIVDFMVRSVEEVLNAEFKKSLSDEGVHILDPFTGTGNFITRIMQQIKRSRLSQKYAGELHCNEVMLLPYYIASMNIEHAYSEAVGEYKAFEGICLVDTFELAESNQQGLFTTENTERVRRQKSAQITVIVANPPYNAKQANESDQNRNRPYRELDGRVRDTYSRDSKAQLRSQLSDPYVKAFRWASDRIGKQGVIAYITNNSFLDQIAFDGMRKHLADKFSKLYILDLGGNVRKNPKLSGTSHNVFGIQVGVCIAILIKHSAEYKQPSKIMYARMEEHWKRPQKEKQLAAWGTVAGVTWLELTPNQQHQWLTEGMADDWNALMPLKEIVSLIGPGLKTNRDRYVFNFDSAMLAQTMQKSIAKYSRQLAELKFTTPQPSVTELTTGDDKDIKWSILTKRLLGSGVPSQFNPNLIRTCSYRPFTAMYVYFDPAWNDRPGKTASFFPFADSKNVVVTVTGIGMHRPFQLLATNAITEHQHASNGQCFARYVFDDQGRRSDNITDRALSIFKQHYAGLSVTKSDVFYSIYAILHHPDYRSRYAANLKRELPRIPFPPDIKFFAKAGERLVELHTNYEGQPEYELVESENREAEWTLRTEGMTLNPEKGELIYNKALTLRGIPVEVFDYRLGNRSALDWVIDQFRVSVDPRSGITNDPNRPDDGRYIIRLIGQVITVSLETMKIVKSLPSLNL